MTATILQFRAASSAKRSPHSPEAVRAGNAARRDWRNRPEHIGPATFFDEAEAQRMTLGPRLPHHRRHPITADEALAGIFLALALFGASVYILARFL